MTTYPAANDPLSALTRADATAEAHSADHGRMIGVWENVLHHGAKRDNSTDDSAAFQAAINAADDAAVSSSRIPTVVIPPGNYRLATALTWKNCSLVGLSAPNSGVRIFWDGAAGATAITKSSGGSACTLENINFRNGTNRPGTWLDLTGVLLDKNLKFENVAFGGSSSDAIKVGCYVNLHWTNMRWDSTGGYAIRITVATSAGGVSGSPQSFVVERFTYDHSTSGDAAPGFIIVDNSTANVSNMGAFYVGHGSIEVNTASNGAVWGSPQAVLHYKAHDTNPATNAWVPEIHDVYFSGPTGAAVLYYRETSDTAHSDAFISRDFRWGSGFSAVHGGTWPTTIPSPTLPSVNHLTGFFSSSPVMFQGRGIQLLPSITDLTHAVAIKGHLSATKTWDAADTADGAVDSTTITVTGASLGDTVAVGHTTAVPAGALLVGAVTASNTVTVTLFNKTGGNLNLASGTLRADVWKH